MQFNFEAQIECNVMWFTLKYSQYTFTSHFILFLVPGNYDAKLAPEPLAFKVKKVDIKEPILPTPRSVYN